jgi:hypothetical protein
MCRIAGCAIFIFCVCPSCLTHSCDGLEPRQSRWHAKAGGPSGRQNICVPRAFRLTTLCRIEGCPTHCILFVGPSCLTCSSVPGACRGGVWQEIRAPGSTAVAAGCNTNEILNQNTDIKAHAAGFGGFFVHGCAEVSRQRIYIIMLRVDVLAFSSNTAKNVMDSTLDALIHKATVSWTDLLFPDSHALIKVRTESRLRCLSFLLGNALHKLVHRHSV